METASRHSPLARKIPGAPEGEAWQLGLHLQIPCLNEAVLQCPAQGHGGDSLVVCWPDTGEERIPPGLHALNTEPSLAQAGRFCGLGLGSTMAEAGASIWLRRPHLFPGTAPWPLGRPALAVDVKIAFSLVPGHSEHELVLLALLEYMGPHCHPVRHEHLPQLQQHGNSSGRLLLFSFYLNAPDHIYSPERVRPP